ncbi:40S ribosomal protein mrp2, mitochondrial [Clydaea vesicula]|uniref:40S ribosomal protein mrp2, mitochondrial n=1 Tax=Clydaea vesicula TaxID=447962 RepID=A0AAD5U725_9FUNG|nr:40S ribosomal protein mrp2, mitochondrial [Clydaea vesicula]KAJ3397254.1 40S ribosomal protein mrp2, mitochondrial [Lobulomyces angularis]
MPLNIGIRDRIARILTSKHEVDREAWRLIVKNKELPLKVRLQAQDFLNSYPRYMRPSAIKNRCIENGKAQGVLDDFKLSRVIFRQEALAGLIPGVKKSIW